ncbi:hypothetical protein MUK42_08453 [Musa troglodytarum]|uniref:Uncharacterized protein n=1 Tax=Musa troglodytarum TaxID=320322 RepID=A0A9E7JHV8_9LILI|nr:hypothetical protein MUK42_08453 [Musa troglodytarum]
MKDSRPAACGAAEVGKVTKHFYVALRLYYVKVRRTDGKKEKHLVNVVPTNQPLPVYIKRIDCDPKPKYLMTIPSASKQVVGKHSYLSERDPLHILSASAKVEEVTKDGLIFPSSHVTFLYWLVRGRPNRIYASLRQHGETLVYNLNDQSLNHYRFPVIVKQDSSLATCRWQLFEDQSPLYDPLSHASFCFVFVHCQWFSNCQLLNSTQKS